MLKKYSNKTASIILLGLAFFAGAILRLYVISDQGFSDNEWYGFYIASVHGYRDIISYAGNIAYSIPLIIYKKLALRTVGWNETVLRLPSVTAGIFTLLFFPLLLFPGKTFNKLTAVTFAFLLSVSPFLIHYSRNSGPYSIVMLLSFAALFFLYFWLTAGKYRYLLMYIGTGVISVYFNLFSAVAVLSPLCCGIIFKLVQRFLNTHKKNVNIVPGLPIILLTGLSIFILLCLLFLPVIMTNSFKGYVAGFMSVEPDHSAVMQPLYEFLIQLSGTADKAVIIFFILFAIIGQVFLFKENKLLAFMFGSIFLVIVPAIITASTAGINSPDVIILVLPIILLSVAIGFNKLSDLFSNIYFIKKYFSPEFISSVFILSFAFLLLSAGPLLSRNSNTTERYKLSYGSLDKNSYHMQSSNIHGFYKRLSEEKGEFSVIEYPMIVPDHYNIYPDYQSLHKKEILIGYFYSHALKKQWHVKNESDTDIWPLEVILGNLDNKKINLANMNIIDLYDINSLRSSKAKYIILHKHLVEEIISVQKGLQNYNDLTIESDSLIFRHIYNFSLHFKKYYQRYFGKPVFEDKWLIVFQI